MIARAAPPVFLVLLALALPFGPSRGNAQSTFDEGQYKISLSSDYVQVAITTILSQNLTQVPIYDITLENENASIIMEPVARAVQGLTSTAKIDSLTLHSDSNGTFTTMSLQFRVLGASSRDRWGASQANLAWRGFNVTDDIMVGGNGLNLAGKHYLSSPLLGLVNASLHPTTEARISFLLDGHSASPLEIQRIAPTINLLDFSELETPLASWFRESSTLSPITTWTRDAGFDIVAVTTIKEPLGGEIKLADSAAYKVKAVLDVPNFASFQGDRVFYGMTVLEPVMTGIIIILTGLAFGVYLLDRRLSFRRTFRAKKRRGT